MGEEITFPEIDITQKDGSLIYDQAALIKKMNVYFQQKGSKFENQIGLCYGLTLLWLRLKSVGKAMWLHNAIRIVINCPDNTIAQVETLIEFLNIVTDKLHNPAKYKPSLKQGDGWKILELKDKDSAGKRMDFHDLVMRLSKMEAGDMMVITGDLKCAEGNNMHTAGAFYDGKKFSFFDSNFQKGGEKVFYLIGLIAKEAVIAIYKNFKLSPKDMNIETELLENSPNRVFRF